MSHKKHKRGQAIAGGAWSKDKIALACLPSGALIDVKYKTSIPAFVPGMAGLDAETFARVSVNVHANTGKVRLMPVDGDELIPLESVISWRLVTLNLKPKKE